jgi:hypothetical protein
VEAEVELHVVEDRVFTCDRPFRIDEEYHDVAIEINK